MSRLRAQKKAPKNKRQYLRGRSDKDLPPRVLTKYTFEIPIRKMNKVDRSKASLV